MKGVIVNFHEPSFEAPVRTASNHHPFLNTPGSVIIILRHATAGVVSVGCPLAVTAMVTVCEGGTGADHVTGPEPGLVEQWAASSTMETRAVTRSLENASW